MIPRLSAALIGALLLAACASAYEARVERSLVDAGLSRRMAGCMADRMVDRLSARQLKSLARLAGMRDRDVGEMRIDEFLRRSQALLDPEIYTVLTRAVLGCSIAS